MVPAELAACLLHGGDGSSGGDAGHRAAGGYVPVAGDLLQFVDLPVNDLHIDAAQGLAADGQHAVLAQIPVHMDKVPGVVAVLLLVYRSVAADEVPGPGVCQQVL